MHSTLFISQTDARPMYLQIVEQIRQRVAAGDWPAGQELPSIRALAADLRVSVITVKRAYLDLESDGKGSFVADAQGLAKDMRLAQLDAHLAAAGEIARSLAMTEVDLVERLRDALNQEAAE
jgi:GntR family transcriptional regulator